MKQDSCIFCKIIADEIPSEKKIYENGEFISFLDIHPKAPGHTLVVPKNHTTWFLDMDDTSYIELMNTVKHVAHNLKEEHGADYIQVGIVGKDIPHVHVHLIPRMLEEQTTI